MCFVRIGTSKGSIHHEFVDTNYSSLRSRDIIQTVFDLKGISTKENQISIYGWLEVDKDNKEIIKP